MDDDAIDDEKAEKDPHPREGEPRGIADVLGRGLAAFRIVDAATIEAERARQAERDRVARFAKLVAHGVPAKDIERIAAGGELLETDAMKAARAYLAQRERPILVLSGTRGCGKTFAASWIATETAGSVRFLTAHRFSRLDRFTEKVMRPIEECDLLELDDVGMEYADEKGAFASKFDGIVDARYAAKRRTVITTNIPPKEIPSRWGERAADRLRESGIVVGITGASLRGGGR